MDQKDLELKINVSKVKDHFCCPICMSILTETYMTRCGHRFCKSCIVECINRKHICPCCNAPLTPDLLFKDPLFDNLIDAVKTEESESEKKYFDRIISAATESATSSFNGDKDLRWLFSPVEDVLKDHLKESLALHEKFYQDLQKDLHRKQTEVDSELKMMIKKLKENKESVLSDAEVEKLREEAETKKDKLMVDTQRCCTLVAQAYNRYLSEHVPSLSVLPVSVNISLLRKSLQFSGIHLNPTDSIDDIKGIICDLVQKKLGENIISFGEDIRFLSFSPLARRSLFEMLHMSTDIIEHGASSPDVTVLPSECQPVLQFAIKPGSEIVVYGTIRCESDMPKVCFASTFRPMDNKPMDYFTCRNCKINWICRPCTDVCHKDHDVTLYIEKHQPTWACCYCERKNKCSIKSS